jgi:hypothetical protein
VGASTAVPTDDFTHIVHLHHGADVVVAATATATFAATVGDTDIVDICSMLPLSFTKIGYI